MPLTSGAAAAVLDQWQFLAELVDDVRSRPMRPIRLPPTSSAGLCSLLNWSPAERTIGSAVQTLRLGPVSTRLCHAASTFQTNPIT
jgi:hypothetical protein